jgi:hypothetical protein
VRAKRIRKFFLRDRSAGERRSDQSRDVVAVGKTSKMIRGDYGQKGDQYRRYQD